MDRPRPLGPDDPALVLMTSGTTGRPKGIVLTLRALQARVDLNLARMRATDALQASLCVLPLFFGHGLIGNCLTPLMAGGTVHLLGTPDIGEMSGLGALIDQNRIRFMSSVPTFWKAVLRLSPPPQQPLERVHVGSAPLSHDLWEQIAGWSGTRAVFNMLGMSETANWISGGALDDAAGRDGYVGRPWGGAFAVLEDGHVARQGRGEVLLSAATEMQAYLNAPDLTAEARHGAWLRTGDIGQLDDSGLVLIGRSKTEINRAGIKVLAEEIDMLLERHTEVDEACAFAVPDPASGEAVAAAVVLKQNSRLQQSDLQAWCRERVRREAVPSLLYIVDAIPRNDRGKVVRADVRDRFFTDGATGSSA